MSSIAPVAWAVLLGGGLGMGLALMLRGLPRWRAVGLTQRILPYVREIADPLHLTPLEPLAVGLPNWRTLLDRLLVGTARVDGIALRLRRAGGTGAGVDLARHRARLLVAAVVGSAVGGVAVVVASVSGHAATVTPLLVPIGAAAGLGWCEWRLRQRAQARVRRIVQELPTVLEFLALCLSAGEGVLDSLRRVGGIGVGDLTGHLRDVVVAVGTGTPLAHALTRSAQDLQIPALSRAVDHIAAALERGAPLADVLQAQAVDAREEAKRALIERAGRNEISMLVPIVFLILPLSVLFAVFRGVFMLRLGLG